MRRLIAKMQRPVLRAHSLRPKFVRLGTAMPVHSRNRCGVLQAASLTHGCRNRRQVVVELTVTAQATDLIGLVTSTRNHIKLRVPRL